MLIAHGLRREERWAGSARKTGGNPRTVRQLMSSRKATLAVLDFIAATRAQEREQEQEQEQRQKEKDRNEE